MRKKFIAFEGIDGCGKSTQIKMLEERLKKVDLNVVTTAEPTKSLLGQIIRKEFLSGNVNIDKTVIDALFLADRIDHIKSENGLLKQLEDNIVLCDRYVISGIVYAAYNFMTIDGMPLFKAIDKAYALNDTPLRLLKPDLVIYLDIDPEESMKRIMAREMLDPDNSGSVEIYEKEPTLLMIHEIYKGVLIKYKNKRQYGKGRYISFKGDVNPNILSDRVYEAVINCINS